MIGWIVYGGTADFSPEGKDGSQTLFIALLDISHFAILSNPSILDFSHVLLKFSLKKDRIAPLLL